MSNFHKKAVAVLFLAVMILVCVPTMFRTSSGFARSLFTRFVKVIAKIESPQSMTAPGNVIQASPDNLSKLPPQFNKNKNIYLDLADKIIQRVELRFDENFYSRLSFIYLHGFVQRLLAKNFVYDVETSRSIVKDSHHRLHFADSVIEDEKVKNWADAVIDLHSFVSARNTPFLYVQVPNKEPPDSKDFPRGITKNINLQLDNLLRQLEAKNVPTIDLRKEIERDKLDWYSLHYRTDHHWRIETAFWAHTKVIERLNIDYHFDLDPQGINRDLHNYKKFSLKFLGTQGRRIGPLYAGLDDFTYYLPQFETQMSVSKIVANGSLKETSGTFVEAICVPRLIEDPHQNEVNRYAVYFGGDFPLVQISNPKGEKRILVIQDSYGLPFCAFLSLSAHQLDIIDLRHFTGSLRKWITQNHYDMILVLYGDSVLHINNHLAERIDE